MHTQKPDSLPTRSSELHPSTTTDPLHSHDPSSISDEALHQYMVEAGHLLLYFTRRFGGRLYLVHKRGIPKKKGFADVFEYASRLGCVSNNKVKEILRIGQHLEPCPTLMALFVSGEAPWTRLKVVASHVRAETDRLWADRVRTLSKHELETLVQDTRPRSGEPRPGPLSLSAEDRDFLSGPDLGW